MDVIPSDLGLGLNTDRFRTGKLFMFVYSLKSRTSLESIRHLPAQVARHKDYNDQYPITIIANHADADHNHQDLSAEGAAIAENLGCAFSEVNEANPQLLQDAVYNLVRDHWLFELKHRINFAAAEAEAQWARRLKLFRKKSPGGVAQDVPAGPSLSAIQEA